MLNAQSKSLKVFDGQEYGTESAASDGELLPEGAG